MFSRSAALIAVLALSLLAGCSEVPEGLEPIDLGRHHFQSGNWAEAIAAFDQAIAADPNNAEAHVLRGRARHIQREVQSALADFDRAIAISPQLSEAYYQRAQALREIGEDEKADADERLARKYDPLREEADIMMTELKPGQDTGARKGRDFAKAEAEPKSESSDEEQTEKELGTKKRSTYFSLDEREQFSGSASDRDEQSSDDQRKSSDDPLARILGFDTATTGTAGQSNPFDIGSQPADLGGAARGGVSDQPSDRLGIQLPESNGNGDSAGDSHEPGSTENKLPIASPAPFGSPGVRSTGIRGDGFTAMPDLLGQNNGSAQTGGSSLGGNGFTGLPAANSNAPTTGLQTQGGFGTGAGAGNSTTSGLVQDLSRQSYETRQAQRREGTASGGRTANLNAGMQTPINPYTARSQPTGTNRRTYQQSFGRGASQPFTPVAPINNSPGSSIPPAAGGFLP